MNQVSSPTIIVERAGSYAWSHKSWRVREEFARTVAAAVGLFASTELPLQRVLLPPVSVSLSYETFFKIISLLIRVSGPCFELHACVLQVLQLLNDPNYSVREAATYCIEVSIKFLNSQSILLYCEFLGFLVTTCLLRCATCALRHTYINENFNTSELITVLDVLKFVDLSILQNQFDELNKSTCEEI